MRGLNLDHLRAFADVAELGSFSAAAERLNLTQPAVSLQVRQLEQRLRVKLLERTGRRSTPTAAGLVLLEHARRIDAAVIGAFDALAEHASGVAGRVRLGTGATACTYLLPPLLRALRTRFPGLEIVVSTGNTAEMLRLLENNGLDVAFATLPIPGRGFQVTPVMDDEFMAIFPPEQAPIPDAVAPDVLAAWPTVLYEPGANTRRIVDDWAARGGLTLRPIMQLGSVEAIKEIVAAGLGCGVLPGMALRGDRTDPRLTVRPLAPPLIRKLAVVLRHDKPLTRGLRAVVDGLQGLGGGG
ncbi:MAG: LysR family transcriptional regulator [Thalassobaculum sp.]|uniref:LysR family transcriptional regulator n=1 Tax=Thalassobaculum sp. TaxID=2022740 RepID=UPI0032EB4A9F